MIMNFRYVGYVWWYELYNSRLLKSKLIFRLTSTLEVIYHILSLNSLMMLRGALPFVLIVSIFLLKLSLNIKLKITLRCSLWHVWIFWFFKFALIDFFSLIYASLFAPIFLSSLCLFFWFSSSPFDIIKRIQFHKNYETRGVHTLWNQAYSPLSMSR